MLPLILLAAGAYIIGDAVLQDDKYAKGGMINSALEYLKEEENIPVEKSLHKGFRWFISYPDDELPMYYEDLSSKNKQEYGTHFKDDQEIIEFAESFGFKKMSNGGMMADGGMMNEPTYDSAGFSREDDKRIKIYSGNKGKLNEIFNEYKNQKNELRANEVFDNEKMKGKSVFLFVNDDFIDQYVQDEDEEAYADENFGFAKGGMMAKGGGVVSNYRLTFMNDDGEKKYMTTVAHNKAEAMKEGKWWEKYPDYHIAKGNYKVVSVVELEKEEEDIQDSSYYKMRNDKRRKKERDLKSKEELMKFMKEKGIEKVVFKNNPVSVKPYSGMMAEGGMMAKGGSFIEGGEGYEGQSILLTNTSSPIKHRFIGKELVLEKKQPNGGFSAFVRNTGEKVPFDIFADDFEQYADGGMMAKGGNVEGKAGSKYKLLMWHTFEDMMDKKKPYRVVYSESQDELNEIAENHQGDYKDNGGSAELFMKRKGKYVKITSYLKKGGKTQGYDDREDERLAMKRGKIAKKDLKSTHARRDDARFEERGK